MEIADRARYGPRMRRVVVVCATALALFAACLRIAERPRPAPAVTAPAVTTDPARLQDFLATRRTPGIAKDPEIRSGDVIRVEVADLAEASREYTVSREGTIRVPFAEEAEVAGMSAKEAAAVIARQLDSVVIDPDVKVELRKGAGSEVVVVGAVERPGRVPLGMKGKTLLEAIAAVGGLTADATGVIRILPAPGSSAPPGLFAEGVPGAPGEKPLEIAAADVLRGGANGPARLYLRAGDRIEAVPKNGVITGAGPDPLLDLDSATADPVEEEEDLAPVPLSRSEIARSAPSAPGAPPPSAAPIVAPGAGGRFKVVGRVRSPGVRSIAETRTVSRAVAGAGLAAGADATRIEVQRQHEGESWRIHVNLTEVQQGHSPDVVLEAGDTIVVP
jgi:protein involved in polysaccharide export with SLBB domain